MFRVSPLSSRNQREREEGGRPGIGATTKKEGNRIEFDGKWTGHFLPRTGWGILLPLGVLSRAPPMKIPRKSWKGKEGGEGNRKRREGTRESHKNPVRFLEPLRTASIARVGELCCHGTPSTVPALKRRYAEEGMKRQGLDGRK